MISKFCGRVRKLCDRFFIKSPAEGPDTIKTVEEISIVVKQSSVTETPQPYHGIRRTLSRRPKFQFRTRVMNLAGNIEDKDLMKRASQSVQVSKTHS